MPYVHTLSITGSVSQILDTVSALTGLGFVAVAHVTERSWTACAVLDKLNFGLKIGNGLDVSTTLCDKVRASASAIFIGHVQESEKYHDHHTPRIYGFQRYFSIPVFRPDGDYFGRLCGLDPAPAALSAPATMSTLKLFADLISRQLEVERVHADVQKELLNERETAELREQFIAVLGPDLRTPLGAFRSGVDLLRMKHADPTTLTVLQRMDRSVGRMDALVEDVVDFTRGRMGQLLSNLLKNAIVHGEPGAPVAIEVDSTEGQFAVSVTNRGKELSSAFIDKLFKPFWRAPSGGAHEGLGLGLFIVSEIARAHGGTIDVRSHRGEVTFAFSMPAIKETPTPPHSRQLP